MLEITNTVIKEKSRPQMLDTMDLERERGITIKLQPVTMTYDPKDIEDKKDVEEVTNQSSISSMSSSSSYVLNLIDTPGHVDFSYEVSRSLKAVEGAILLVDATKGVQAQTLAHLHIAKENNLKGDYMKKIGLVIAIVVGLIIVIGGLYYFYIKFLKVETPPVIPITSTTIPTAKTQNLACNTAIEKTKLQPEVVDYLALVPNAKFECNSQDDASILIRVYEIVEEEGDFPSHSATMGWYIVKPTGEIEKYM